MHVRFNRPARFVAAAVIPFVFAAALPVADGMTYEFVMKSTGKATGNKEEVTMRGRGTYAGDEAKIEILDAAASTGGNQVFGGKGTYFILKGAGKDMFLVNPGEKSYMKWDMASMFAGMGKVVNAVGGLVKMQMSDVRISAQDMGAGQTIEGLPTRHVQMIQNYTMTASMFGRKSVNRSETKTDYYFAPSLRISNPFMSNSQQMSMMSQLDIFNNPDYKTQMMAAMEKMPKNGVPLRMVSTAISTDAKGKAETTVTTMEMINLKRANVSSSAFAIPSDYKMVQMPNLNAAGMANGDANDGNPRESLNADSIAAAAKEGAKQSVKDAVKDEAKAAATKKLKGIFKR